MKDRVLNLPVTDIRVEIINEAQTYGGNCQIGDLFLIPNFFNQKDFVRISSSLGCCLLSKFRQTASKTFTILIFDEAPTTAISGANANTLSYEDRKKVVGDISISGAGVTLLNNSIYPMTTSVFSRGKSKDAYGALFVGSSTTLSNANEFTLILGMRGF